MALRRRTSSVLETTRQRLAGLQVHNSSAELQHVSSAHQRRHRKGVDSSRAMEVSEEPIARTISKLNDVHFATRADIHRPFFKRR